MTIREDDLERTQRLPLLTKECNCPSENMIIHVVGCPHHRPMRIEITGRPLADLGLDGAVVIHPDGQVTPLIGIYFHRWDDRISLLENLRHAFGEQYPGCRLVFPL